tara:strand:- start:95 stop:568 length:474 start_codon:yes stop_codon:yes gene_type:complete
MDYKKKYLEYKLKYLTAKKIVSKNKKVLKGGSESNYMKNTLTTEELEKKLRDYLNGGSDYKILLICYAGWCGYCKQLKEPIDELYKLLESDGDNKLLTIDVSENDDFNKYELHGGYPTLLLLNNKKNEERQDNIFDNFNITNLENRDINYLYDLINN